jgi:hypothetical protein
MEEKTTTIWSFVLLQGLKKVQWDDVWSPSRIDEEKPLGYIVEWDTNHRYG